jgi:hypothetical protein
MLVDQLAGPMADCLVDKTAALRAVLMVEMKAVKMAA